MKARVFQLVALAALSGTIYTLTKMLLSVVANALLWGQGSQLFCQ